MVRGILGAVALLIFFISFSPAAEETRKDEVILNFQNADVRDIAQFMAKITGKNIIVDSAVRGKITIEFSKPVSVKRAWDIFTSALSMHGFGAVEEKGVVKILPISEAITVAKVKRRPSEGELVVLVYNLRHTDAQTAMNAIRPFLSSFARVSVHMPSNSVILADVGENVEKAKRILSDLDREEIEAEVAVYKLKHLSARDAIRLITPLNTIIAKRFGLQLVVASSEEANSLVVFGPKGAHRFIEEIFKQIDTEEVVSEQRSFYIIPLKFVSAEEISESLQSLLGGRRAGGRTVVQTRRTYQRPTQKKPPAGRKPAQRQRAGKTQPPTKPIPFITTKEGMKIGFDRGTNSVLLYATRTEYEGIKNLISKLDVRRKQVLIAATIVEASARKLLDIGIKWQVLGQYGGAAFGGSSLTDIYSSFLSGNFVLGAFSETGKTITIGTTTLFFPDLVLLFSLLETGTGFNIIANPKVLTLDNQPAIIKVGQVVPYAEGVKFDINGQPIITYDYKEVGLELKVTPRIAGDNLRVTIDLSLQEIIEFVKNQIGTTSYTVPVTSNREVNSDVVIENGQTIILGGLVSTKTLRTIEGIPGLSRIPILGRLFRRDFDQRDKTTLFIFITPYVVSSPEELSRITEEHRRIMEELKKRIEERKKQMEEEDEEDIF
jgi:general secretion pathway protein D